MIPAALTQPLLNPRGISIEVAPLSRRHRESNIQAAGFSALTRSERDQPEPVQSPVRIQCGSPGAFDAAVSLTR